MPDNVARADADWLALREPADAGARSTDLVEALRPHLPTDGLMVHDLGCGTGSMARWLAPQLAGPQHWVGYERDDELLSRAAAAPPPLSRDGQPVTIETRLRDITRLPTDDLDGASLITASALLDMMTSDEISRTVASISAARCPALITLTVVGQVELAPAHPLDGHLNAAFNAHQMRDTSHGQPLAGPDAVYVAAHALKQAGYTLQSTPSLWRLCSDDSALLKAWLEGWVDAACEQDPSIRIEASEYRGRRIQQIDRRQLTATVHHQDLLALQ
ncbi:class I SAM-dependent methyltransferase [Janibacter sp. DB-40]|uniref:class I SAM-dependent methyltransferase n=1 Tax=Janibacter sp. DB-40 TaxID=3028808 RepID=UPI0024064C1F|nr:class I SAM-dependent methyltransferase [Janibacter sp. DB-40]